MYENREKHVAESTALLKRGVKPGDIIDACEAKPAIIRRCHHTGRRHVVICFDCIIRQNVAPRFVMVCFSAYRGPALKGYLLDQHGETPQAINSVRVVSVGPKSCVVEIVS